MLDQLSRSRTLVTSLEDFANRVHKNARHFRKWARRRGIEAYRVYDRDIPEFAFALDVYGKHAHLQEYDRGADSGFERAEEWVRGVHAAAAQALGMRVEDVVLK